MPHLVELVGHRVILMRTNFYAQAGCQDRMRLSVIDCLLVERSGFVFGS